MGNVFGTGTIVGLTSKSSGTSMTGRLGLF
jgi:hypothetical protein